jgi:hypothetical protein
MKKVRLYLKKTKNPYEEKHKDLMKGVRVLFFENLSNI